MRERACGAGEDCGEWEAMGEEGQGLGGLGAGGLAAGLALPAADRGERWRSCGNDPGKSCFLTSGGLNHSL